jgi:hypothetical protein
MRKAFTLSARLVLAFFLTAPATYGKPISLENAPT